MFDVSLLLNLQTLDRSISKLRKDISETETSIGDDSAVVKAGNIFQQISTAHQTVNKNQREIEREIERLSDRKNSIESKIYAGEINSPKELTALQAEVGNLSDLIDSKEEVLLARMEETERYDQGLVKSTTQLESAEINHQKKVANLQLKQQQLINQLNAEEPAQQIARERCSVNLLHIYDRVGKANKGIAIALVESDRCSECRLSIPKKLLDTLKTADEFVYCNSCGRILCRDSYK
jgi:predicted  nucleic acid-binding Zn-ribbon protein